MDSEIVKWILAFSGFLVAFGVIWKFVRYVFRVDKAMPVLLSIAAQFDNNGGGTLKDSIDQIRSGQELLSQTVNIKWQEQAIENRIVLGIAEDSRLIAKTNAAIVNELSQTQTEDIAHIKEYLHEKMHEINNNLGKNQLQAAITEKRSLRIEQRLDEIIPYVQRHREDYNGNE